MEANPTSFLPLFTDPVKTKSTDSTTDAPATHRAFLFSDDDQSAKKVFPKKHFIVLGLTLALLLFGGLFTVLRFNSDVQIKLHSAAPAKHLPDSQALIDSGNDSSIKMQPLSGNDESRASNTPVAKSSDVATATSENKPETILASDNNAQNPGSEPVAPVESTIPVAKKSTGNRRVQVQEQEVAVVQHELVVMAVHQVDTKSALIEIDGRLYRVHPGDTLPDHKTVYIGFDPGESVIHTTSGDFRLN